MEDTSAGRDDGPLGEMCGESLKCRRDRIWNDSNLRLSDSVFFFFSPLHQSEQKDNDGGKQETKNQRDE